MIYHIRLLTTVQGESTPYDGQYVGYYDPTVHWPSGKYDGGDLEVTDDPAAAVSFSTPGEAIEYWRQPTGCRCHGVRPDGELNRPLTAWTVEIVESPVPSQ